MSNIAPEDIYDRLKRHEGLRLFPYRDSLGNPTIGFGHKLAEDQAHVYKHGITEQMAEQLLYADVLLARNRVNQMLPWISQLNLVRQDVLVEMAFQLGATGLLGFNDLLFCLRSGNYAGAAKAMLHSKWHAQTPDRCAELAHLMLEGE